MMKKDKPKIVIIEHVKWRKQRCDPQFYPAADTDQFKKLTECNRGTLIFIPKDEDYSATRDEFSDNCRSTKDLFGYAGLMITLLKNKYFNI